MTSMTSMSEPVPVSRRRARHLAVMGQLLDAPRRGSIEEVVRGLGEVQMDPTSAVARTEQLVLFSRLGRRFRVTELERLLWRDRVLFEYWAHIVPTGDLPLHRISMRRYPHGAWKRREYVRDWLEANDAFVRYVIGELRRRGPLRARDLENRAAEGWHTGGWNDEGQNVPMLLDILWLQGRVMIVGRDGQQRIWDLASRSLPGVPARPPSAIATELVDRQLRARGLERLDRIGYLFDGPVPMRDVSIRRHLREGLIVPIEVDGLQGRWVTHRDLLDETFRGRTTLLSPFDDLISDRERTERLFDFRFRLEIYVPKAKREFGYFVLPILRADRLVGRVDPLFSRREGVLRVNAIYAEEDARRADGPAVRRAIEELAAWLEATDISWPTFPSVWR
ncbi:MAG: winged helix-turn-helix domain-containing protein [Actinobacteria bacterium]|nr:MAG: winged helix-turn-helix domain-containing protein [Actinomycetota bacterium]